MVKFSVEKKALSEATIMLAQVANLKSIGAAPAESSGIQLTPTTMILTNNNEANGIRVEGIPITVLDGNVGEHVEDVSMINTKKFASIVKGSKATINFLVTKDKIAIGEGNRRFDLAVYSTPQVDAPVITFSDEKIQIKDVVKNLIDSNLITENSTDITELAGTLLTGDKLISSDRISVLYIEHGGLFCDEHNDMVIPADLFSACLSKTTEKEATIGITEGRNSVALQIGNITLTKCLMTSKYPKKQLYGHIDNTSKDIDESVVRATISLKEFMEKLHEIREIVEADDYYLKFLKDGSVSIENNNTKGGAEGTVYVDATVVMSDELGEEISGKFSYTHLDLFGKLFSGEENIELHSSIGNQGTTKVLRFLAVKTQGRMFFCTPKQ